VLDLCNKRDLYRELQSKYSIYHACAIGLVRGKGGILEFTMDAVNDPDIKRIRDVVSAAADDSVTEDQCAIEVDLQNGETLTLFVEQSLGNIHRPLSNAFLDEKFRDQAILALPAERADKLIALCWGLEDVADAGDLVRLSAP
jgi:2-methylcitrate dehydratase PrpD